MSGSLDVHGFIDDWSAVEAYLFNGTKAEDEDLAFTSFENDWKWEDDQELANSSSRSNSSLTSPLLDKKNGKIWTQECVIALSPATDVMVVCRNERAVFLSSEWDSTVNQTKYSKLFEGKLSQDGEKITSALCIPLVSSKKSSPGGPDWTCILVGFSDGYVRMYMETGNIIIEQMFHDQPVTGFKCHSYKPSITQNEHDQLEEVFILYKTVLVTIDGFGLFQTLRGCRSRIARVQANAADSMADPPPLTYKKWQYESKGVSDCESVGVQTPSLFDHLLTASVIGGITARPSKLPFTSTVFATVGSQPYISFHYAQEGQAPFMIGRLAYSVANKLTSSLINAASGWLGFGGGNAKQTNQSTTKPEKPKIEPPTPMAGRFGLPDKDRKGRAIIISPCHKLSAVTDSLGRVVLIDNERGIAVRMWKGYRDPQCAWLNINDDMNSKTKLSGRKALFLVIYAPRKGQLEVFSMQQGPKVANFQVSKSGRLFGLSYGMMGLNNIPMKNNKSHPNVQCLFLDPEGSLYQLHIPFHLALCDTNNSKLKDMHLLKSLQRLLRDSEPSKDDINGILNDVKTQSMINQAFKILIQYCMDCRLLIDVVESYLEKFCEDEQRDLTVPFKIQSLLNLYLNLSKSMEAPPPYSKSGESSSSDNTVLICLHATEKEVKLVKDLANKELFNNSSPRKGVSFADEKAVMSVNDFLSLFSIEYDPAKIKLSTNSAENKLQLNHKNDNLPNLGNVLFCGCFNNNSDLAEWKTLLKSCDLNPTELIEEILKYWCSNALASSSFIDMMSRLYLVVRSICDLEGIMNTVNENSAWWDKIRKGVAKNNKIFYIYTFALVCRAVAIDLNQEADKKENHIKRKNEQADLANPNCTGEDSVSDMEVENPEIEDEGWENVSLDLIRWNILLKQIEDLSFLSTILSQQPPFNDSILPRLPLGTINDLSVIYLLEKGPGCIAEFVGKWLTTIGIDPIAIVDDSEIPAKLMPPAEYTDKEMKQKLEKQKSVQKMEIDEQTKLEVAAQAGSEISYILELLRCLKDNFTVSLNSSIILSNFCWEYCLAWNQNVENVNYLSAATKCVVAIPSHFIKQGLMSMIWNTFLSKQLANIVAREKTKKEKLLEKSAVINNPESRITFLNVCVTFLDEFMETNVLCQGTIPPKTSSKKNHWSTGSSPSSASLTDLALTQPLANYEMILLHYQLALAALFVYNFGIRKVSMRPMNLFDTKACMMIFAPINSPAPYSNVEVDLALKILREEFLCLLVTNVISKIPEELDNSAEHDSDEFGISPSFAGVQECEQWIHKCFELGRIWGLDLDSLRINQVCELYSSGFDLLGLEKTGAVTARDILGSRLLMLAGMRLHYYIQSHPDSTTEIVSSMNTNTYNFINKQDYSKLRCLRFPKSSISELGRTIIQLIPETSYDYKLADDLLMCSSFLAS